MLKTYPKGVMKCTHVDVQYVTSKDLESIPGLSRVQMKKSPKKRPKAK